MVSPNNPSAAAKASDALPHDVVQEQVRVVAGLYDRLKELMADWSRNSQAASDATVLAVAQYYHSRCRELDALMAQVERAAVGLSPAIDLGQLRQARRHIAMVLAVDPVQILKAEQDVREGRTMTLEQMRRELRNPAH